MKRLAHVPAINAGVLELAAKPQLLAHVSPALLTEIAASAENRLLGSAVRLLEDMLEACLYMDRPPRITAIKTLAALRQRSLDVDEEFQRHVELKKRDFRFPAPPVPGMADIVPLTDVGQLLEEGRQQRNCVGGYGERVAAGTVFVYRVLVPERATLSIQPSADGGYEIQQLLLSCNRPVAPATEQAVRRWLAGESVSI